MQSCNELTRVLTSRGLTVRLCAMLSLLPMVVTADTVPEGQHSWQSYVNLRQIGMVLSMHGDGGFGKLALESGTNVVCDVSAEQVFLRLLEDKRVPLHLLVTHAYRVSVMPGETDNSKVLKEFGAAYLTWSMPADKWQHARDFVWRSAGDPNRYEFPILWDKDPKLYGDSVSFLMSDGTVESMPADAFSQYKKAATEWMMPSLVDPTGLLDLLRRGSIEDRVWAVRLLGARKDAKFLPEVASALEGDNMHVRIAAIRLNLAGEDGGGVYFRGSGCMQNCIVADNVAVGRGGGVDVTTKGDVLHCTVVGNLSFGGGGGIYHWFDDGGTIANTIVSLNHDSGGFDNLLAPEADDGTVTNCLIGEDPLLIDVSGGDYRLASTSPAIDAGTPVFSSDTDIDGTPRPLDGDTDGVAVPDIGAYEHLNPMADSDGDGVRDGDESVADTDPTDARSRLEVLQISKAMGGIRIDWRGGRNAWQFLETSGDLRDATGWTPIYGLPPPTPLTNAVIHFGSTNAMLFYRIRAQR